MIAGGGDQSSEALSDGKLGCGCDQGLDFVATQTGPECGGVLERIAGSWMTGIVVIEHYRTVGSSECGKHRKKTIVRGIDQQPPLLGADEFTSAVAQLELCVSIDEWGGLADGGS